MFSKFRVETCKFRLSRFRRRMSLAASFFIACSALHSQTSRSFSVVYSFTGGGDGGNPAANENLISDGAGNLYGTTPSGGSGNGVVFQATPAAGSETALYSFTGKSGLTPSAGVILDARGNLYGTTEGGGSNKYGVVFRGKDLWRRNCLA